MTVIKQSPIIRNIDKTGHISLALGIELAGTQMLVTRNEDGTILLKPGKFIPDSEMWLYKGDGEKRLDEGLNWAKKNKRKDNSDEIMEKCFP
jgi:hypothetical protein